MFDSGSSTLIEHHSFLFVSTDTLNYTRPRNTKYYAIAGITQEMPVSDNKLTMQSSITTYADINDFINSNGLDISNGDNVVGFLSQIGWSDNSGVSPNKKINMEKISINVDEPGASSIFNLFHNKMPHRTDVIDKVLEFLQS